MVRVVYTIVVVSLLGASAVIASGIGDRHHKHKSGAGIVLMTTLRH